MRAAPPVLVLSAPPVRGAGDEHDIQDALGHAGRLVGAATHALGFEDLGSITLPPIVGSVGDADRLRAIAPLYLAAELEMAGLVPAAEVLAGVVVTGGIGTDLGPAGELLVSFWRRRRQRFAPEERRAFYARLFGTPSRHVLAVRAAVNTSFEPMLLHMAEALVASGRAPRRRTSSTANLGVVASEVAALLVTASAGVPDVVARELLATIQEALTIFKQPEVQRAVGARSPWTAVREASVRYLDQDVDIAAHVARAKAGMRMLDWLAGVLRPLGEVGSRLQVPDDVVVDAFSWLRATHALVEPRSLDA